MTPSAPGPAPLSPEPSGAAGVQGAKAALRRRLLAARRSRSRAEVDAAAAPLADAALGVLPLLGAAGAAGSGTVAGYASAGTEPPTAQLLDRLRAGGRTVLLPVLREDDDLDWAVWDGASRPGRRGLREPAGPRMGVDAVRSAPLVVVPALAVGRDGTRLGRGGGSYDRALARAPRARVLALLWDGELLDAVPAQPHDRRVHAVATPSGALVLAPGAG